MSVENISFILMKSSFTIYEDIQTTSIKYTQTHVHWVQDVLDVFTVTKYREKLLVITQFRSHVWFHWGQGGEAGWPGWGRTEVDALTVEAASVNTEVLTATLPPSPSALPLMLVFTRPATCNTQLTAERESVTSTMTEITLQPSSNVLENYQ